MLQSLRVSEAGMLGQQNKLEIVANNLANASTPGFKRMLTTFQAVAPQAPGFEGVDPNALPGGAVDVMVPGSMLRLRSAPDLSPGPMRPTGNRLDVAIGGDGLFAVQTDAGERYTRAGNFTISPEDQLVTAAGDTVLGEGGPIEIPPTSFVEIALDGTVRADGDEVGRLRLVTPETALDLTPDGATSFALRDGAAPVRAVDPAEIRVQAGFLEGSNANPVSELVSMITAQRIFEAGQRVLSATDETLRKATTEIPKIG